jgi:hypothetical protein
MIRQKEGMFSAVGGPQPPGTTGAGRFRGWVALLGALVAVGVVGVAYSWMGTVPLAAPAAEQVREDNPKCAALARVVAARSHSIFDAERYRATERQAYEVCVANPAAFRHIVRGY